MMLFRLVDEGVCSEQNVPSISSINRIIRDKCHRLTTTQHEQDVRTSHSLTHSHSVSVFVTAL